MLVILYIFSNIESNQIRFLEAAKPTTFLLKEKVVVFSPWQNLEKLDYKYFTL